MTYGVGAMWTVDDIRRDILALEESAPYQKSDFYRVFARRLQEMFGDFKVVKGDDTKVSVGIMYANPERAVAKITEGKNITLPLISLQFEGIEQDNARRKPLEALNEMRFWDDSTQRAYRYMALAPYAANLIFACNVWGKYIEEVNQLTEQILLRFRPNMPIEIRESEIYQSFIRDVDEASDFTPGDRQDRIIKRRVRFEVQSYIPGNVYKFTDTGEIKSMNFQVFQEETSGMVALESWYAGGGAAFANGSINRGANITTIPGS